MLVHADPAPRVPYPIATSPRRYISHNNKSSMHRRTRKSTMITVVMLMAGSFAWTAGTGHCHASSTADSVPNPYAIGRGATPPADVPLWSLPGRSGPEAPSEATTNGIGGSAPAAGDTRAQPCASFAEKVKRRCRTVLLRDPSAPRALQFSGPPEVSELNFSGPVPGKKNAWRTKNRKT